MSRILSYNEFLYEIDHVTGKSLFGVNIRSVRSENGVSIRVQHREEKMVEVCIDASLYFANSKFIPHVVINVPTMNNLTVEMLAAVAHCTTAATVLASNLDLMMTTISEVSVSKEFRSKF